MLFEAKHPIVLGERYSTEVDLRCQHQVMFHQGTEVVHETHWIFGARRLLKNIKYRCVVCRWLSTKTIILCMKLRLPLLADRVICIKPFSLCGLDYAGPLTVRKTTEHQTGKAWIADFVSGTTRAVHLELMPS